MAKSSKTLNNNGYDGSNIKELPFPLCVQQRAQMYIGPTDGSGVLTCLREIVNNSVDEFLAGHCTHIHIKRTGELSFEVMDNGRGVPFDEYEDKNSLSRIFGTLHAGRNFTEKTVYSTGINGVGSTCVNALSAQFEVLSKRDKDYGRINFEEGYEKELKVGRFKATPKAPFNKSSTTVKFSLERKFFDKDLVVDNDALLSLIRETAYLNNGLTIVYEDSVIDLKETLLYTDGVTELLKEKVLKNPILKNPIALGSETIKDSKIEISFSYDNSFNSENIHSFCNTIRTTEGGSHVTGFKRSISQKLLAYVIENKLVKEKVTNDDIYSGLNAVVSVFVFNPKYTSQTKQQLKNTEVMGHVVSFTNKALDEWLNTNPAELKVIAAKLDLVAKSRIAQKRALDSIKKESGSSLTMLSNIAKFSDCEEQMSGRTELFLVEGQLHLPS